MKKNYIKPAIGMECMETSSLLEASLGHADSQQAATGTEGSPANLSRQGGFWDESE